MPTRRISTDPGWFGLYALPGFLGSSFIAIGALGSKTASAANAAQANAIAAAAKTAANNAAKVATEQATAAKTAASAATKEATTAATNIAVVHMAKGRDAWVPPYCVRVEPQFNAIQELSPEEHSDMRRMKGLSPAEKQKSNDLPLLFQNLPGLTWSL